MNPDQKKKPIWINQTGSENLFRVIMTKLYVFEFLINHKTNETVPNKYARVASNQKK